MKTCILETNLFLRTCALLMTATALLTSAVRADQSVRILRPNKTFQGKTYGEWAVRFWQWSLALPVEGHPFLNSPDDPYYNFGASQSGKVWFWSAPDGPLTRIVSMPEDKALFLTIRDVE